MTKNSVPPVQIRELARRLRRPVDSTVTALEARHLPIFTDASGALVTDVPSAQLLTTALAARNRDAGLVETAVRSEKAEP